VAGLILNPIRREPARHFFKSTSIFYRTTFYIQLFALVLVIILNRSRFVSHQPKQMTTLFSFFFRALEVIGFDATNWN
jgi:hypothetical protein